MTANEHLTKLTDEQFRDTIGKLKHIEETAAAVLSGVTKERATFNRRVFAEIERRKELIKSDAKNEIDAIRAQARESIDTRSAQIEQESLEKKEGITEAFNANRDAWRKKIYENVLFGE